MKYKATSSVGAVLVAAVIASLFPMSYANPAANYQPQSSGSRASRGKTSWDSSKRAMSQPNRRVVKDRTQQSSQSAQRREPPPFDRPPIGSTSRRSDPAASQTARRTSSDVGTSRRSERTDPQKQSRAQTFETEKASPEARASEPPGLDQEDRGKGERPVLRRPSESVAQDEQNSQSQRPAQQMGLAKRTDAVNSSDDDVVRLESTLVSIPLLVSDRAGRYIPQLSKRDFKLYEDDVEQEIATFANEEVAFNVVLLLDMSPSVSGSVEAIQDACIAFVQQMRSQDRLMVVSFDRRIRYLTGFTNNPRELEYAIRSTRTGSGTSVYDAVYETVGRRLRDVEGRKALILFSDGEDTTSSNASYDDAIEMVRESDVLVYGLRFPPEDFVFRLIDPTLRNPFPQIPIPIPWPLPRRRRGPITMTDPLSNPTQPTPSTGAQPQRRRGNGDFMADVATAGGGPVYDAQNVRDFSRLANQIAEELRHIYAISYYPTNKLSNGGYRAVRVRVKGNDSLAVRHRKGYSAANASRTNPSR
jgi:hypothetical protein